MKETDRKGLLVYVGREWGVDERDGRVSTSHFPHMRKTRVLWVFPFSLLLSLARSLPLPVFLSIPHSLPPSLHLSLLPLFLITPLSVILFSPFQFPSTSHFLLLIDHPILPFLHHLPDFSLFFSFITCSHLPFSRPTVSHTHPSSLSEFLSLSFSMSVFLSLFPVRYSEVCYCYSGVCVVVCGMFD